MRRDEWDGRLLAVYLTARGYAFALFERPLTPLDWGTMEGRPPARKNAQCMEGVANLVERYQPDTLVIEDCSVSGSLRSKRIRRLYRSLEAFARRQNIDVYRYSRKDVRSCFEKLGSATKYEIAQSISALMPEFLHQMPPLRRAWMNEHPRMGIFDVAALAQTFFYAVGSWDRSRPKSATP